MWVLGASEGRGTMIRFATIGTSGICELFCEALACCDDARLVATYSRNLERARAFGERFGAALFFDSLEELACCKEVDAVYIASPNALHAPQALQMIASGKHVLVEKPFASNESQAREVFDAARKAGLVALEATRSLHVPTFDVIERVVRCELGPVRLATLRFSKVTSRMARLRAAERINVFDSHLSGGALMDMGVYCVEPAIALFGRPNSIRALALTSPVPGCSEDDPCGVVDLCGEALLGYDDKIVSLSYGKTSDDVLASQVEGERATLTWEPTSGPMKLRLFEHEDKGQVFRIEGASGVPLEVDVPHNDMVCEIGDFVGAVLGSEEALAKRERFEGVTLDSLSVMDEIRRQIGVRFPTDPS